MISCNRCGVKGMAGVLAHAKTCAFFTPEGFPPDEVRHTMRDGYLELRVRLVGAERVLRRENVGGRLEMGMTDVAEGEIDRLRWARPDAGLHFAKLFLTRTKPASTTPRTNEQRAASRARIAELMRKVVPAKAS